MTDSTEKIISNGLNLNIADLNIKIDNDKMLPLPISEAHYEKHYDKFITPACGENHILTWQIEEKDFIFGDELREITTFPDNSWQLYHNNAEDKFIALGTQNPEFPFRVMHFPRNCQKMSIYVSECNKTAKFEDYGRFFIRPADYLFLLYYLLRIYGVIMHAAAVVVDGKGYIFSGVSGAGKSTIAELFTKHGTGLWLSDERVIVKEPQTKISMTYAPYVYGTPWPGTADIALNAGAPLAGIFFIMRGNEPTIRQLNFKESMKKLCAVASIPWYDEEFSEYGCNTLTKLIGSIPMFEFSYRPDEKAIQFWQEFITKFD